MLTETTTPDLRTRALEEYDRVFSGDGAPRPLADLRRQARDVLAERGLPTKRDEAWKYTDLRPLLRHDWAFLPVRVPTLTEADLAAYAVPGLGAARVVVVNGVFAVGLSDLDGLDRVTVRSLREALAANDEIAHAFLGRQAGTDEAFAALNAAFDLDGVFLHVPDGVVVERPIHIVHLTDTDTDAFAQSRHLFVFGRNSQARVVESHHARGGARTFGNPVTEAAVGPDAVIDHYRIQDEGEAASQVNTTHVRQERGSVFSTATFTFEAGLVRNNLTIVPDGEGCETNLTGLYVGLGSQHVDNSTLVDHTQPGCQSNELYKGILYDRATGVFNGKVFVHRAAQQTNAYQQSQGVVLSDDAHHYSKPELEIYADDVKCSHGSTTGEIDPEALFYCRARGIAFEDARAMLLYAFAHDIVERVKLEPLRAWLGAQIEARLK